MTPMEPTPISTDPMHVVAEGTDRMTDSTDGTGPRQARDSGRHFKTARLTRRTLLKGLGGAVVAAGASKVLAGAAAGTKAHVKPVA